MAAIAVFSSVFVMSTAQATSSNSCKISKSDLRTIHSVGWPDSLASLPSIGSPNILVIGIDFIDDTEPGSAKQFLNSALELNKVKEYFVAVSGGLFEPRFEIIPNWVRMPEASSFYGSSTFQDSLIDNKWATSTLSQGALSAVENIIDLSKINMVIIVVSGGVTMSGNVSNSFPNTALKGRGTSEISGFAIVGKGAMQVPGLASWKVIAHEINHLLGLADLYLYGENGWWQAKTNGPFGIQGFLQGGSSDSLGWSLWLLDWLSDSRVICQNKPVSVKQIVLSASNANPSKAQLLVVNLSPTKNLVIEALKAKGYESSTYSDSVLVYTVDSSTKSGEGPVRIIPNPTKLTLMPLSSAIPDWVRFKEAPLTPESYLKFEDFLIVNNGPIGDAVSISFLVGEKAAIEFARLEKLKESKLSGQSRVSRGLRP